MMKEHEYCAISNVGFTVICSLLSVFIVLTFILTGILIRCHYHYRKKYRRAVQNQSGPNQNYAFAADRSDVSREQIAHIPPRHFLYPHYGSQMPFEPVRMRHIGESSNHNYNAQPILTNTGSVASELNENRSHTTHDSHDGSHPVMNDVNRDSQVVVDEKNIGLFDHASYDSSLNDLFKPSDRSFTQTVLGKQLVSIAKDVTSKGDILFLDNMGISLHVPEGAVHEGETKRIVLVLNWDLSDNPEMKNDESLVSPVVYVGPHGLKLNKACTLAFRHCAFDPRQIRVLRSETEITETKSWEAMCDRDDVSGSCYLTPDECQLKINTFTLFTCIQTPLNNVIGKKWLQIAVFACPLRQNADHHPMRVYFLNKTNCALQWAIQSEAKFGGKLVCPEKTFLFDGGDLDMFTESTYISDGWELIDDKKCESVAFLNIWHGQCPHITMCFRRNTKKRKSSSSRKSALEINLKLFAYQNTLNEVGEIIVIQMLEDEKAQRSVVVAPCNHHTNIKVVTYNASNKSEDSAYPPSVTCKEDSYDSDTSSDSASSHKGKHSGGRVNVTVVHKNKTVQELRSSNFHDTPVTRNIPHNLRKQLVILLDPVRTPIGNDWRDFASALHLDELIPSLEASGNPTSNLLDKVEERDIRLDELKDIFLSIQREDCVREICKYIKEEIKDTDNLTEAAKEKEPTENEYDSGIHGNRNLHSEESSWTGNFASNLYEGVSSSSKGCVQTDRPSLTDSSGFKSNPPNDSFLHSRDITLMKSVYNS
ncbi:netrin receptor [Mactra antiquata]